MKKLFEKYDGFIFDLDGTLYRGSKIIEGAKETVNSLVNMGKDLIFVSNKTTGSAEEYFSFLVKNGLAVFSSRILTSAEVVRNFLAVNFTGKNFYAIGEKVFIEELQKAEINFSENPSEIDVVIITLDRTLNLEKIEIAAKALEKGAYFFAANIDDTCPVDEGEITDAGAVISLLEKRTYRKLEDHFGKPSLHMFSEIRRAMKFPPERYLIVGDRLLTDIKMGNDFGLDTALVNTGVKNNFGLYGEIQPTYKLHSVADLLDIVEEENEANRKK